MAESRHDSPSATGLTETLREFSTWPSDYDSNYACLALSCWWEAADKYRATGGKESAISSTGNFDSLDDFHNCGNAIVAWLNRNDIECGPLADARLAIMYRIAGDEDIGLAEISRSVDRVFDLLDKLAGLGLPPADTGSSEFILAPEDLAILQTLVESPSALPQVEIADRAGYDRKIVGERVKHLKEAGAVASPPGKINQIGITDRGRELLKNSQPS